MALKIAAVLLVFFSIVTIYYFGFYRPRYVRKEAEWRASYGLRPESARFATDVVLGAVLVFAVAFAVTGKLHLALMALPGGFLYARWQAGRRRKRKQELLRSQFVQVIANLSSSLSGGLSPYQALEEITPSLPEPARSVFVGILRQTRAGSGYLDAIRDARKATDWEELDLLATALDIYRETGGNLVEVFQYMQESLAGREADRRYVNSLLAQIRMTARVLSALPFFLVLVARLLAPEFMAPLLDEPAGNVLLLLIVGSIAFGNVFIERMVRGDGRMMHVATVAVYVLFLAGVFAAGLWDARERRIPNKLNLTLLVLGLLNGYLSGQIGSSLLGAAFSFFLSMLPAFIMRMPVLQAVGGGDIKMMTAVGAFYGLTFSLFWAFGTGSVLSVVYGIVRLYRSGYLKAYVLLRPFGVLDVPETRVPFGSFLALGIMMYETIMFVMNLL